MKRILSLVLVKISLLSPLIIGSQQTTTNNKQRQATNDKRHTTNNKQGQTTNDKQRQMTNNKWQTINNDKRQTRTNDKQQMTNYTQRQTTKNDKQQQTIINECLSWKLTTLIPGPPGLLWLIEPLWQSWLINYQSKDSRRIRIVYLVLFGLSITTQ